MDHGEAVKQMFAERYLLNELPCAEREAFEAHFFGCPECALDLRAGVAFVDEAKLQLATLNVSMPTPARVRQGKQNKSKVRREWWLSWLQPAFAAPVFATLLLVIGYQNLVTYPGMRAAASQPQLLTWAPLHGATRGAQAAITTDRQHGLALPIDLPPQPTLGAYASYTFDLKFSDPASPQGRVVWSGSVAAAPGGSGDDQRISLIIPSAILKNGAYTVAVTGIAAHGERTVIDQYAFELHLTD